MRIWGSLPAIRTCSLQVHDTHQPQRHSPPVKGDEFGVHLALGQALIGWELIFCNSAGFSGPILNLLSHWVKMSHHKNESQKFNTRNSGWTMMNYDELMFSGIFWQNPSKSFKIPHSSILQKLVAVWGKDLKMRAWAAEEKHGLVPQSDRRAWNAWW